MPYLESMVARARAAALAELQGARANNENGRASSGCASGRVATKSKARRVITGTAPRVREREREVGGLERGRGGKDGGCCGVSRRRRLKKWRAGAGARPASRGRPNDKTISSSIIICNNSHGLT
jgi:hypothetical protein